MAEDELDYEPKFIRRLWNLGPSYFIKKYDTIAGVITIFLVLLWNGGPVAPHQITGLLDVFVAVSASLFAIILTGFAIITSFTDKLFVVAWKEIGEFDNIITLFQYNLYLPLVVLSVSVVLNYFVFDGYVAVFLIGLFVYMLFSLIDLVNLIGKYSLQRGEFIKQLFESQKTANSNDPSLSVEELEQIHESLTEFEESESE